MENLKISLRLFEDFFKKPQRKCRPLDNGKRKASMHPLSRASFVAERKIAKKILRKLPRKCQESCQDVAATWPHQRAKWRAAADTSFGSFYKL